jgi:hypothetical protein
VLGQSPPAGSGGLGQEEVAVSGLQFEDDRSGAAEVNTTVEALTDP